MFSQKRKYITNIKNITLIASGMHGVFTALVYLYLKSLRLSAMNEKQMNGRIKRFKRK